MSGKTIMTKDYYVVLGVPSDATREEIKAAFRRRALQLHPDRSGLESQPFLEIQEAYEVLSDPEHRWRYDRQLDTQQVPPSSRRPSWTAPAEPVVPPRPPAEPFRSGTPVRRFASLVRATPDPRELFTVEAVWADYGTKPFCSVVRFRVRAAGPWQVKS